MTCHKVSNHYYTEFVELVLRCLLSEKGLFDTWTISQLVQLSRIWKDCLVEGIQKLSSIVLPITFSQNCIAVKLFVLQIELKVLRIIRREFSFKYLRKITRVEVPEIIGAEKRSFRVLTFFSADSENLKNIIADQLFQKESALFSADFLSSETLGFQRWTALIYSESALIFTHRDGNMKLW